jgi:hypothetical protein
MVPQPQHRARINAGIDAPSRPPIPLSPFLRYRHEPLHVDRLHAKHLPLTTNPVPHALRPPATDFHVPSSRPVIAPEPCERLTKVVPPGDSLLYRHRFDVGEPEGRVAPGSLNANPLAVDLSETCLRRLDGVVVEEDRTPDQHQEANGGHHEVVWLLMAVNDPGDLQDRDNEDHKDEDHDHVLGGVTPLCWLG